MKKDVRQKWHRRACLLIQQVSILGHALRNDPKFLNIYGAQPLVIETVQKLKKLPDDILANEFYELELDADADYMHGMNFYADIVENLKRFFQFTQSPATDILGCQYILPPEAKKYYDAFVDTVALYKK